MRNFLFLLFFLLNFIKISAQLDVKISEEICISLIEVPVDECICNVADDCCVYRSKYLVPKSIIPYEFVSNTDNSTSYSRIDTKTIRFKTNTRYKSLNEKSSYYTLDNGTGDYVYIISKNH